MNWLDEINSEKQIFNETFTFYEYMEYLRENPKRECRTNSKYLKDMFDHFECDERGKFNLFSKKHSNSPAVQGQIDAQKAIYNNLKNFIEEGFNNKFILLVGPNGSSKSSIVRKMMKTAEEYSKTSEGGLYTFSWIFPIDQFVKGPLGLTTVENDRNLDSFAKLEDKDISSILGSDLKDHPLLLIPIESRRKLIDDYFAADKEYLDQIKKSYLYNGDISKRNRLIFDALLKSYKGNMESVYKHIRVERFIISQTHSSSAVTIEPQLHVDAKMQQITMDKRLASLPPSLQSLNLFSLHGELILSNRGILEFSDLLKRPLDAYKYLLMTMESKTINIQGILTELDTFFIGSSNEVHLAAFKQHPDYNSFKGRLNFIRVPYLLNYEDEENIYLEQIDNLERDVHFEPYALQSLCLFSVMTRLRPSQKKNFKDQELGEIIASLFPIEKALFYTKREMPSRLNSEQRKMLKMTYEDIKKEYVNDNLYEGKFGISPREVKQIVYELVLGKKFITFFDVLDYLKTFIDRKNEHDFLNISPQGEYNNYPRFLDALKKHFLDIYDGEVRSSLGIVDELSYESHISRYVKHVNILIKGEKIKNKITGKYEVGDEYFLKEFEKNIDLKEDANVFRSNLISTLGAYSLDNPGSEIKYASVFPDLVKRHKESFIVEQRKIIAKISKNLVFYVEEKQTKNKDKKIVKTSLTKDGREQIEKLLTTLQSKYKYSELGAIGLLKNLIKERY